MGRPAPGFSSEQLLQYSLVSFKAAVCTMFVMLLLHTALHAQPICGFDQANTSLQKHHPQLKSRMLLNEQKIRNFIQQRKSSILPQKRGGVNIYTIPVVVHVLHTGEPVGTIYNPAAEKITSAIDYLNEIYSGTGAWPHAGGN